MDKPSTQLDPRDILKIPCEKEFEMKDLLIAGSSFIPIYRALRENGVSVFVSCKEIPGVKVPLSPIYLDNISYYQYAIKFELEKVKMIFDFIEKRRLKIEDEEVQPSKKKQRTE